MPVGDFFSGLTDRKSDRRAQRQGRAVQTCPKLTGDVLIGVFNSATLEPIAGVDTKLDGAGAKKTDDMGVAVYSDLEPKTYAYTVLYGADYDMWERAGEAGSVGVSGDSVSVVTSSVVPTGALRVTVKLKHPDGALETLDPRQVVSITADRTATNANPELFERLRIGETTVTVKVDSGTYGAASQTGAAMIVAGETAELEFTVEKMSWIAFKLVDVDTNKIVDDAVFTVKLPDGSQATVPTAQKEARERFRAGQAKTNITQIKAGDDDGPLYEFVELA